MPFRNADGRARGQWAAFARLFMEPARRTAASAREFLVVRELWPTGKRQVWGTPAANGKGPETHGPVGAKREFRRKSV